MLALLLLLYGVYEIGEAYGEIAESWAMGILMLVLLIVFIKVGRDNDRAYGNAVRYWRDGGPDRREHGTKRD